MKKVRILFTAMVIVASMAGAWATRPCQACTGQQQYYNQGGQFFPAGEYMGDYQCDTDFPQNTCTFTKNGSIYTACRLGLYTPL